MIYCMNIGDSDIKEISLHGNHHANIVYCNKFEFGHEKLGFLYCNDVIVMDKKELDELDRESLDENDRIYYGTLKVYNAYLSGKKESLNAENESGFTETISDSDIYPIEQ
ncbi:hypothetical protein DVN97_004398 [Escherichia coli]|nr:hypothetical protein [Escherichia coli]EKC7973780.1 hypothetical protein [Escherichia coli]WAK44096.1 hypothetical protein [Escherichia virus CAM-21]WPJ71973.1 hypothetical protein [Escherichia phage vB-Eco-KMB42]